MNYIDTIWEYHTKPVNVSIASCWNPCHRDKAHQFWGVFVRRLDHFYRFWFLPCSPLLMLDIRWFWLFLSFLFGIPWLNITNHEQSLLTAFCQVKHPFATLRSCDSYDHLRLGLSRAVVAWSPAWSLDIFPAENFPKEEEFIQAIRTTEVARLLFQRRILCSSLTSDSCCISIQIYI